MRSHCDLCQALGDATILRVIPPRPVDSLRLTSVERDNTLTTLENISGTRHDFSAFTILFGLTRILVEGSVGELNHTLYSFTANRSTVFLEVSSGKPRLTYLIA